MTNDSVEAGLGDAALGTTGENFENTRIEDPGKAEAAAYAGKQEIEDAQALENEAFGKRLHAEAEAGFPWSDESQPKVPEADALEKDAGYARSRADRLEKEAAEDYEYENPESISDEERKRLAAEAVRALDEKERFLLTRTLRRAVGIIEAMKHGLIKPALGEELAVLKAANTDIRYTTLSDERQQQLRAAIYAEVGEEPPDIKDLEPYGKVNSDDPDAPGADILRRITLGRDGVGLYEQVLLKRNRIGRKVIVDHRISAKTTQHLREVFYPGEAKWFDPRYDADDPHDY